MKNSICLIVILSCFSCKKDKTEPVDIREQYKGLFKVRIAHHYSSFSFPPSVDTSYNTILRVDYAVSDSVAYSKSSVMPAISLYDTISKKIYARLGVDATGKIYNQYNRLYSIYEGGFVGRDSINCYFGGEDNHSSEVDTLVGYRIK